MVNGGEGRLKQGKLVFTVMVPAVFTVIDMLFYIVAQVATLAKGCQVIKPVVMVVMVQVGYC